jgi:hypothetical protein
VRKKQRLFVADELLEAGVTPAILMKAQGGQASPEINKVWSSLNRKEAAPGACTSKPIALYRFSFLRLMTVV